VYTNSSFRAIFVSHETKKFVVTNKKSGFEIFIHKKLAYR